MWYSVGKVACEFDYLNKGRLMEKKVIYLDPKQPIEKRVNDLLKRMTIDEKIDQMFTTGCNELEPILEKVQKGELQGISASFVYYGFNTYKICSNSHTFKPYKISFDIFLGSVLFEVYQFY